MKCRNCIRMIELDSRFCRHCGRKVARVLGAGIVAEPAVAATSGRSTAERTAIRANAESRGEHAMNRVGAAASTVAEHPIARATIGGQAELAKPDDVTVKAPSAPIGDVYRDPRLEQSIWQARPAWRASTGSWFMLILISGGGLYAASRFGGGDRSLVQVAWIFVVGAAVTMLAREALVVFGFRYHLTTQRLFLHRGVLTRVTDQLELIRVDDVRVIQGVIDRIVNTGRIEIYSSDATDESFTLESISAPMEVAEAIRLHVRGARSKGTLSVEQV
ncbi:MAG: PH domain-containing protein [Phycisphaerae bacterium]|nr:PH domain-containing protein [Phycisphaerae bacterium]